MNYLRLDYSAHFNAKYASAVVKCISLGTIPRNVTTLVHSSLIPFPRTV